MKAKARAILMDIPDYAKGDQELWTYKLVKDALVDAFRMLRRTGGRVGPAAVRAAWPTYRMDQADFVEQAIAGTLKDSSSSAPVDRTRMTVTRMEMVLCGWKDEDGREHPAWLAGIPDTELREKLEAWVFAELRGTATTDLCVRKGWALATFKRHRDRAAGCKPRRPERLGRVQ